MISVNRRRGINGLQWQWATMEQQGDDFRKQPDRCALLAAKRTSDGGAILMFAVYGTPK